MTNMIRGESAVCKNPNNSNRTENTVVSWILNQCLVIINIYLKQPSGFNFLPVREVQQGTHPPLLTPRSRCFCPGVSGWRWGRRKGRRRQRGTSAAAGSSGQSDRGCTGRLPSTGLRLCASSEPSGRDTDGTVDTGESMSRRQHGWVSVCGVW